MKLSCQHVLTENSVRNLSSLKRDQNAIMIERMKGEIIVFFTQAGMLVGDI